MTNRLTLVIAPKSDARGALSRQSPDDFLTEFRQIIRDPSGNDIPVSYGRDIQELSACIDQIILYGNVAGGFLSSHYACRDKNPLSVAYGRNDFTLFMAVTDQLQGGFVPPQVIR